MTSLLESPVAAVVVGSLVTIVLIIALLRTGRRSMLIAALLAIAATVGLVVLERSVVTEREQVEQTIYAIAAAVERNDVPEALSYVHSSSKTIREQAEREFGSWQFSRVVVKNNLEVELQGGEPATEATATFNVVVILSSRDGGLVDQHVARVVKVTLLKEGGDWRVSDYTHMNIMGKPDQHSPRN